MGTALLFLEGVCCSTFVISAVKWTKMSDKLKRKNFGTALSWIISCMLIVWLPIIAKTIDKIFFL